MPIPLESGETGQSVAMKTSRFGQEGRRMPRKGPIVVLNYATYDRFFG